MPGQDILGFKLLDLCNNNFWMATIGGIHRQYCIGTDLQWNTTLVGR